MNEDKLPMAWGPASTCTFWMAKVISLIETVRNSSMVLTVAGFVAEEAVKEQMDKEYPDGLDADGVPIGSWDRLERICQQEQAAYEEYVGIFDRWSDGQEYFLRACKLLHMISEANLVHLSALSEDTALDRFEVECGEAFNGLVQVCIAMMEMTRAKAPPPPSH